MAADSTTTASVLTTEQVHAVLTEPLLAESVVLASGPQIVDSAEPVRFPVITEYPINADSAASVLGEAWVGENGEIPEQDPEWDEVVVLPQRKSIKIIHRFSNELARQSVVNVGQQLLQNALGEACRLSRSTPRSLNGSGAEQRHHRHHQRVGGRHVVDRDRLAVRRRPLRRRRSALATTPRRTSGG